MDTFAPPPDAAVMAAPSPMPMPAFAPTGPIGPTPAEVLDVIGEAIRQFEAEAEEATKPVYPHWLTMTGTGKNEHPVDFPKPDAAEKLSYARRLHNEYAGLRSRISEDIRFLSGTEGGYFPDATDDEKQVLYHDPTVQAEYNLISAQLGAIEPIYKPEVRRRADNDEAADKADFLYACDAEADRRHVMAGNGAFRYDVIQTALINGRVALQTMYKLECEDGEIPFRENLVDPATCCPVFDDDRGMSHMIRVYRTTLAQACAAFGYAEGNRQKLAELKKRKKHNDSTNVEVVEYWDRWWKLVWVDADLIIGPVAHRLGEPPFIYQMGVLGLPAFLQTQSVVHEYDRYAITTYANMPAAAQANKGISFLHFYRYPIWLREAITARVLTHFRRSIDPSWLVEQDHIAAAKGIPEISRNPGDVSSIEKDHENAQQIDNGPPPDSYGPLMQLNNDALGRLGLPAEAYGINAAGTNSGFAIEHLSEQGRDKLMPHLLTLQMFYQQLAERRLKLYRDWGWLTKQGEEDRGKLYVTRQRPLPLQDPQFLITPGDIRRTGYRCSVKMTRLKQQSLTQMTNALAIMNNMGMGNPVYFYEMIGHPNPERAVQEDEHWKMMQDPALRRANLIETLKQNGEFEKAAFIEAQGAQEAAAPPMLPTDQLSAGRPINYQGASNPMVGQPPGPVQ